MTFISSHGSDDEDIVPEQYPPDGKLAAATEYDARIAEARAKEAEARAKEAEARANEKEAEARIIEAQLALANISKDKATGSSKSSKSTDNQSSNADGNGGVKGAPASSSWQSINAKRLKKVESGEYRTKSLTDSESEFRRYKKAKDAWQDGFQRSIAANLEGE